MHSPVIAAHACQHLQLRLADIWLSLTFLQLYTIRIVAQVTRLCLCTTCVPLVHPQYTITSFYGAEIPLLFCVVDKMYSVRLDVKQYRVFCVPI